MSWVGGTAIAHQSSGSGGSCALWWAGWLLGGVVVGGGGWCVFLVVCSRWGELFFGPRPCCWWEGRGVIFWLVFGGLVRAVV